MLRKLIIIISLFIPAAIIAQEQNTDSIPSIKVLSRVIQQKVILRWAPDNPNVWLSGNQFGYIIERYTILKEGKLTDYRDKKVLNSSSIKPLPLEQWEKMADTSDYAAVAAQAIYGSDFEINVNKPNNVYSIFNKVRETESRYTFTLHSANQSLLIARSAALAFEDTTALKSESYLYRIYIPLPAGSMKVDTGIIFVDAGKIDPLPKLRGISATTSGNAVMLAWNTLHYDRDYVSYVIERSDDGGQNYHSLTEQPYINLGTDESATPVRMVYLDSLPLFNYQYFYRIRGKSPFAETGPPSDTVQVIAQKGVYNPPCNLSGEILENKVLLHWELPAGSEEGVKGIQVERASVPEAEYHRLNNQILLPDTRMFTDTLPGSSNYYRVRVIDMESNSHVSLPYFVQMEDSIPPLPPQMLSGVIDTSGLIRISWNRNTEPDLLGYRVYRSYFKVSEYTQVTTSPVQANTYTEKVNLRNLNKYLYYKITSNDTHHNQSGFSEILRVRQPDIVPPAPPAYRSVKVTMEGIKISLIPSNSDDIKEYLIYRKEYQDSSWILLNVLSPLDSLALTDSSTQAGTNYIYNTLTVDSSGNESQPVRSIKCKAINSEKKIVPVIQLKKNAENKGIEIHWYLNNSDAESVIIYKALDSGSFSIYKNRAFKDKFYIDENIKINHTYSYMIKVILKNGVDTELSNLKRL